MKKVVGSGVGSGSGSDPLVRGTDPGIRIRTKMSRIPNTGCQFKILDFSGGAPRTLSTRMCTFCTIGQIFSADDGPINIFSSILV